MDEITEKRLEREWRSVRVERFSTITEWRCLEPPAREIAEATEAEDAERVDRLMNALHEVHLEGLRLENQDAIIDGFGILSGRVKGAATTSSGGH